MATIPHDVSHLPTRHMSQANDLAGFILKKEACRIYDRSFRQLGRDFDKASVKGDAEFTSNFKLRIEDGTVMEASEVDKDKVQTLRDRGLNPTWLVRESWMRDTYGVRPSSKDDNSVPNMGQPPPQPAKQVDTDPIPADKSNPDIVQAKDDLIAVLRDETNHLREMLSKERERSGDDKQLTRELHVLLKNMQDRLLPAPSAEHGNLPIDAASQPPKPLTSTVAVPEHQETQPVPKPTITGTAQSNKKITQQPATPQTKKTPKRKGARKPKRPPKKEPLPKKSKWYTMPTFKRLFSNQK